MGLTGVVWCVWPGCEGNTFMLRNCQQFHICVNVDGWQSVVMEYYSLFFFYSKKREVYQFFGERVRLGHLVCPLKRTKENDRGFKWNLCRKHGVRVSHDKSNMFKLWHICQNEHGTAGCVTFGRTKCDCTVDLRARGTWPSVTAHCWVCFMAEREAAGRVSRVCCSPGLEVHFSDLIMIDCWYDFMTHYWPAAHLLLLSIIWLRSLLAAETEWMGFSLCSQTGWFYRLNVLGMTRTVREVNKNRSQVFRELCYCSAGFPSGCDLLSNTACCCYGNFSPSKYWIKIFCCLMLYLLVLYICSILFSQNHYFERLSSE